jgi:hypothetical protein
MWCGRNLLETFHFPVDHRNVYVVQVSFSTDCTTCLQCPPSSHLSPPQTFNFEINCRQFLPPHFPFPHEAKVKDRLDLEDWKMWTESRKKEKNKFQTCDWDFKGALLACDVGRCAAPGDNHHQRAVIFRFLNETREIVFRNTAVGKFTLSWASSIHFALSLGITLPLTLGSLHQIFFFLRTFPHYWGFSSTIQVSWSHTIDTYGRTPLDEWSARRRGLYLHRTTQHRNTRDKHPCPQRN